MVKVRSRKVALTALIMLFALCAVAVTGIVATGAENKNKAAQISAEGGSITSLGAAVQLSEDFDADDSLFVSDSGIRFNFGIDKSYFNGEFTTNGYKVNAYVVPKWLADTNSDGVVSADDVKSAEHVQVKPIDKSKWKDGGVAGTYYEKYSGMVCSYAWIYGIPAEAYGMDICAVAIIEDSSGNAVYTSEIETNSFMYLASEAVLDEDVDASVKTTLKSKFMSEFDFGFTVSDSVNVYTENVDDEIAQTFQIEASAENTRLPDKAITFIGGDDGVATVGDDGLVTFVSKGTTTATVSLLGGVVTKTINVNARQYYEIDSPEDFFAINDDLNGHYVLEQDIDFRDNIINGINSTDPKDWHSIGWSWGTSLTQREFTGIFDGKGYALTNITLTGTNALDGSSLLFAPLFFKLEGGTIKNVYADITIATQLANGTVLGTSLGTSGLIGSLSKNGIVDNCIVKYKTDRTGYNATNDQAAVGAIVGRLEGDNANKYIRNCVGIFDIGNYNATNSRATNVGTIVGNAVTFFNTLKIENCYSMYIKDTDAITVNVVGNIRNADVIPATPENNAYDNVDDLLSALNTAFSSNLGFNSYWSVSGDGNSLYFNSNRVLWKTIALAYDYSVKDGGAVTVSGLSGDLVSVKYGGTDYISDSSISSGTLTLSPTLVSALALGESKIDIATSAVDYALTFTKATDIITTTDEFFAINNDTTGYYILGQTLDFIGITIDSEDKYKAIGAASHENSTANTFKGTFDGRGFGLENVAVKGYGTGENANLFRHITGGTIKNAYFEITIKATAANQYMGLIGTTLGCTIENCYSIVYSAVCGTAARVPLSSFVAFGASGGVTIKNSVGVIQFADTITADTEGYVTMVGRLGNSNSQFLNSYGLVLSSNGKKAKAYCDSKYNAAYSDPQVDTSEQFTSTNDMLKAMANASTGIASKGFNSYWKIQGGNLVFGSKTILTAA